MTTDRLNEISGVTVDAAFHIHKDVGPGLFESVYGVLLLDSLRRQGLRVAAQVIVPVVINGRHFDQGFRADLIVEDAVIIELKSLDHILPVHSKKLLTYLRLTDLRLGLLLNFGAAVMKDGIKRIVNRLDESDRLAIEKTGS